MIPGVRVGHATDAVGLTGCTVILPDQPAVAGAEIRGWAAGVHGLEFLDPRHLVPTMDGIVLSGGSAFGLESIWGVMQYLEERGVGFPVGVTVVPHVAGAIIFDLGVGDHRVRPDRTMGYRACQAAQPGPVAEGNVGAGTGAAVGKLHRMARAMRGGLGCAVVSRGPIAIGAIMVSTRGDVRDLRRAGFAGTRDSAQPHLIDTAAAPPPASPRFSRSTPPSAPSSPHRPHQNRRASAQRMAIRAVAAASGDGDTLFCLSVGGRVDVDSSGPAAG
jgi:L-aminopeptidase/D-esterase-like protein